MTPLNLLGFLKFTQLYAVIVVCTSLQNADGNFNPMKTTLIQTPFLQNGSGHPQIVSDNWNIASDSTTTEPLETTRTNLHEVLLDLENPEDERGFTSTTAVIYRLPANDDDYSSYRLAIHLKTCDYDDNELIWIGKDTGNVTWRCSKKASNARHVGDPYVEVQHFLDDVKEEVIIAAKFTASNYNRNKAIIVVNLYRDFDRPSRCPRGYFDCQQSLCQKNSKKNSRCIPNVLKCDGSPNCGMTGNVDETNEVCRAETYCRGWYLTGSYGVLSLAMVVLFVGNYS